MDLGHELYTNRRSWRWLRVRLAGLLARDTPTAILVRDEDTESPAPTRRPSRRYTPAQIGDVLDGWSRKP